MFHDQHCYFSLLQVSVKDLLTQACATVPEDPDQEIIVYDQCTSDPNQLSADCFLMVLLKKLHAVFNQVSLLKGNVLNTCFYAEDTTYEPHTIFSSAVNVRLSS